MVTYFENLTIRLYIFYVFNAHVKFWVNWVLFTIQFINLFFMPNFRQQPLNLKHLIDNITIDF